MTRLVFRLSLPPLDPTRPVPWRWLARVSVVGVAAVAGLLEAIAWGIAARR